MNKYTAVVILLASSISSVLAQSFEGKITYENTYTSNIPNATSEQFNQMMGTVQEYYIKGSKYKSITNGSVSKMQLYVPSENKLYSQLAVSDTLLWSDGSSNPNEPLSYEIKQDQAEILGYTCDALIVDTKMGKIIYYFSEKIKLDPKLYEAHKYGNWALLTGQTKSLPLKIEMETPQFTLVSVATEIKEMELDDSFFDLPELPAKKSPY